MCEGGLGPYGEKDMSHVRWRDMSHVSAFPPVQELERLEVERVEMIRQHLCQYTQLRHETDMFNQSVSSPPQAEAPGPRGDHCPVAGEVVTTDEPEWAVGSLGTGLQGVLSPMRTHPKCRSGYSARFPRTKLMVVNQLKTILAAPVNLLPKR